MSDLSCEPECFLLDLLVLMDSCSYFCFLYLLSLSSSAIVFSYTLLSVIFLSNFTPLLALSDYGFVLLNIVLSLQ